MSVLRVLLRGLAVLAVWLGLARFSGRVQFTPAMTDTLIRVTDWLNIDGVEDVENFYMAATPALSFVPAVLLVAPGSRALSWVSGAR